MIYLLRKLPLHVKLLLIGIFPMAFIVYLAVSLQQQSRESLTNLTTYRDHIHQTQDLYLLVDALQQERKGSFDVVIKKWGTAQLKRQRITTNEAIANLNKATLPEFTRINDFTNLGQIDSMRQAIDRRKAAPDAITHYYSNIIFRLNTLSKTGITSEPEVKEVYQDMSSQKLLSEMYTYLAIIRSNFYNVLYTRKYVAETLFGTLGTYDVFKSFEKQLLIKASPVIIEEYMSMKEGSIYGPIIQYLDESFAKFKVGTSFTADSWWDLSHKAAEQLNGLRVQTWQRVLARIDTVYTQKEKELNQSLIALMVVVTLLILFIIYTIVEITGALNQLRFAAERIAMGETGQSYGQYANDALGSLALSIQKIDEHYQRVAFAAAAIGKGKFSVNIKPRSNVDILGKALFDMKQELVQYSQKMEEMVAQRTLELQRSNQDLQQFAHVASHDLKEPLRKIQMYTDRLMQQLGTKLPESARTQLEKVNDSSKRMSDMIEGILHYSSFEQVEDEMEAVDLDKIIAGVKEDLELVIQQKQAVIESTSLPKVMGIPVLLRQVFYNLIFNALKFSKENEPPLISIAPLTDQGKLAALTGSRKQDIVAIRISDNGIGFSQEHSNKLFQLFKRLHPRSSYEGTGLGLALCRKIIERHGGTIHAEGREGAGASFTLVLPTAKENRKEEELSRKGIIEAE